MRESRQERLNCLCLMSRGSKAPNRPIKMVTCFSGSQLKPDSMSSTPLHRTQPLWGYLSHFCILKVLTAERQTSCAPPRLELAGGDGLPHVLSTSGASLADVATLGWFIPQRGLTTLARRLKQDALGAPLPSKSTTLPASQNLQQPVRLLAEKFSSENLDGNQHRNLWASQQVSSNRTPGRCPFESLDLSWF